jgi:hypothetical protein
MSQTTLRRISHLNADEDNLLHTHSHAGEIKGTHLEWEGCLTFRFQSVSGLHIPRPQIKQTIFFLSKNKSRRAGGKGTYSSVEEQSELQVHLGYKRL